MEYVTDIPYGLAVCHLDGEQAAVLALSDSGLRVRLDRPAPGKSLLLHFLREGAYRAFSPRAWRLASCRRGKLGYEIEIAVDDEAFRRLALLALGDFAAHIRALMEGEAFPGGETAASLSDQKALWFRESMTPPPGTWEFALSLDGPEKYEDYLRMNITDFQRALLQNNRLSHHALFARPAARLYVGNAYCQRLFPSKEQLSAILAKVEGEGLKATVVLPTARWEAPLWAADLAEEIEANDWGTLCRLRGKRLLLGRLLNRRRKDPRLTDGTGLAENSLNDPSFRALLAGLGVGRYEYEACGYAVSVAPGKHSLHLPFFQTNTSHDCGLSAACQGRDPGVGDGRCRVECRERALLYPDEMGLVGRYNSIFALDRGILADPSGLSAWLSRGIDRVVLETL